MNLSALPTTSVFPSSATAVNGSSTTAGGRTGNTNSSATSSAEKKGSGTQQLDTQDQAKVTELQKRDREVRAHEAAHMAAGGAYIRGGPSFQFTTGPDGKSYATGGEVSIDSAPIPDDPAATIQKMRTVQRAALAPAQPSAQDLSVAATAAQNEAKARMEQFRNQSGDSNNEGASPTPSPGSLINEFA